VDLGIASAEAAGGEGRGERGGERGIGLQNRTLKTSKVSLSEVLIFLISARHIGQDNSFFSLDSDRIY
jgi:hypothetical protein